MLGCSREDMDLVSAAMKATMAVPLPWATNPRRVALLGLFESDYKLLLHSLCLRYSCWCVLQVYCRFRLPVYKKGSVSTTHLAYCSYVITGSSTRIWTPISRQQGSYFKQRVSLEKRREIVFRIVMLLQVYLNCLVVQNQTLTKGKVIKIFYNYFDPSVCCHSTIARVWRPPQATSLAFQCPSASLPLRLLGGGISIGTSIGWPVVTFLPYPSRPWSPRPNCQQKTSQHIQVFESNPSQNGPNWTNNEANICNHPRHSSEQNSLNWQSYRS